MNWDDYRYFLAVARHKTLKAAGKNLGVDQATVGRRLTALQERLGAQLLEKRSDGFFLTAAGNRILESVESAEQSMLTIDRAIVGKDERIEGTVKIAMPGALANQWIIGTLGPLLEANPKLEIQFLTGPEIVNLSRRDADLAVRLVRPKQRDLKTRKVGVVKLGLYKAKDSGRVKLEGEVPFVGLFDYAMSELERNFVATFDFTPRYRLRSAAWTSVLASVRAGMGLGVLPTFMGAKDKALECVSVDDHETPLWLVVHPEVAESARVRATIDHLTKALAKG